MPPSRSERLDQRSLRRATLGDSFAIRERGKQVGVAGGRETEDPYRDAEDRYANLPPSEISRAVIKELVSSDVADSVEGAALHASRAAALAGLAILKSSTETQQTASQV